MAIRRSDFAGSWYPGNAQECRNAIEDFTKQGIACPSSGEKRVGGIVPHAGWYFSGRIACNVIKCLTINSEPETVVIFGGHLRPSSDNFIMKEGAWETPLGELEVDNELGERLFSEFSFKEETTSHHMQDNTIELQLPFIKYFASDVKILTMAVPPTLASLEIGQRTAEISMEIGRKIIFIGSTDLTHYGNNYGYTPKGTGKKAVDWVKNENDKRVIDLMLDMDAEGVIKESLKNYNACCSGAVATAIAAMKTLGAVKGEKLIYSTSYDIRPDSSFVGYVGIVY